VDNLVFEPDHSKQHGLITKERAEKFDLLGQLILNQREAIVLCGSEWIGKTTLLNILKKTRESVWVVCLLHGLEALSFEQIEIYLILSIREYYPELKSDDLPFMLSFCEKQQQKVVLLIDDAVELAAGLITTLTEYGLGNPALRLVFTFTRDELYLKNTTDSVLDDCYFMEIPALTKSQIAIFLQDFSVLSNPAGQKIDSSLLLELYQLSDGVPGKIVAYLPLLPDLKRKRRLHLWLKSILLICSVVITVTVFYGYDNSHQVSKKTVKSMIKSHVVAVEPQKKAINTAQTSDSSKAIKLTVNRQAVLQEADEQWVLQQAAEKYTLQLMAFAKREPLQKIVNHYQPLQIDLKILQITTTAGQKKYVLLYGTFADTKTASANIKSLPAEFKEAWPRKFDTLLQEIKKRTISFNQLPPK
jgi:DamX protein